MKELKQIKSALISVYDKTNLEPIIKKLNQLHVKIFSTGGTKDYIEKLGVPVTAVEDLTNYPSILGGRVKTLHPKIFGGILTRRNNESDKKQIEEYQIPEIDLVIVDLYPFEATVASGANEQEIIEKIDIGGISLIRATAKNFNDTLIVPSKDLYHDFINILDLKNGYTSLTDRKRFALEAFNVSSHYDTAIFNYFNKDFSKTVFKQSINQGEELRYGENPHQKGFFFGNLNEAFDQLNGKQISYNNLLDIEAAVQLISEFTEATFAILKHNNACGIASRENLTDAWIAALAGDPVSAYGGILITNKPIDKTTAEEVNKIFFEVIIAPAYDTAALNILKEKKNRIILVQKINNFPDIQFRSLLNGVILQNRDLKMETESDMKVVTLKSPDTIAIQDLIFANKLVKHSKSNTIVLAKNKQLCASGVGQTSRVDALKQAIIKANQFGFDLQGAVMASDAFFPFADSVEIAGKAGITSVIQPGGSVKDQDSIDYCNKHDIAMVFTGIRHFKH
ncbi:MAG: bifunctional phosphoribosylaminoimidazolecarboxamide formyltransferase/IMP cyclohydrolase [Bacteroidetes bacterium GWC2_33_15]|nr:MAG: bifunctional phosphoribosylaminoimidazolecarboxamide formyltransferase/IMP cyclohydrolase [Bacteroidetes bacterium GWA2_33_15]OFX51896.1 MAG: bifunctional phosphoribosylaminoimidazolecarboxamide formyltransferase/IMP cyclohydrolase [Bacteroidetes bacterium GWC2_33_15]OFX63464.1 MAG: bifunctional phosphoribosylaminoimidazolecarboxamide formyltransferase/IMP cyclohydrolase [Bacteroidetes bacterium GWB2_32_14]OFX67187.1 MAG: bifunctional phosphoribosylaminoimidazolecarboxamide formyltransfe